MEKQKKFSLKNYLYEYKWWYVFGIAILLCVDLANIYIPQFIGDIIDGLTNETLTKAGIPMMLMKILIAGLIMMFGRFGWRYCIFGASRKIEYRLRNDMFGHLETLSARYFNEHKTGDLMAHFTNDLEAVRVAVGMAVITTFDAAVMSIMVIIKMIIYVDLRLTVLAFVPMILVAIGCYFFGVQMKKRQTARQEAFSFLSDKVQESISGIRVLKAFVQEKKDLEEFQKANENNMEKNLAVVKLRSLFGPLLDLITGISLLLTLIIGGKMVINGTVSVGQFVAFNSYIGMLVWPMIACGDCINTFSQASAGYKRIKDTFDEKPDIIDKVKEKDGEHLTGDIELNNLTFQYPDGDTPVLKNVSVHIKPGEMLAVLGRTGSGKSTLLEAIAVAYGFNAEGGTKNYSFSTYNSHSELCEAMTISKGYRRPKFGYFLRAESFYNVATKEIDYSDDDHPSKGYHQKSHGESFLAIAQDYMGADGVYIFDEPEAALSPQRQLTLLINIYRCAQEGAQFIIVSHSPILLGMPDAEIFSFDNGTIHPCQYEDTDSYVITKTFVNNRQHFLNQLLNEET